MNNYASAVQKSNKNTNEFDTTNSRNYKPQNISNGPNYINNRHKADKNPEIAEHPLMQQIINEINSNYRVMIMMRGAPGSGKSHLTRTIIDRTMDGDYNNHIFSTDDFFYNPRTKQYKFDFTKLSEFHDKNQFRVTQRALNGWSPIIVDNTHIKVWEMFPYAKVGIQNGYLIRILEPNTPWSKSVGQLSKRNTHQVDAEKISKMLTNFEKVSVEGLIRGMNMRPVDQPQLRTFPQIKTEVNHTVTSNSISQFGENSSENTVIESNQNTVNNWVSFEAEQKNFWNTKPTNIPNTLTQSVQKVENINNQNTGTNNIFELLREAKAEADNSDENATKTVSLERHEKNCLNENNTFQEIRLIYPNVPISLLWDLFEKCNGDGDWTMDILLNEDYIDGIRKLSTDEDIERDNFICSCRSSTVSTELLDAAKAIPIELLEDYDKPSTSNYQKLPRKVTKTIQKSESENVRKLIEEQFVISDEHYSNHTRKIRDFRRNQSAPNTEIKIDGYDVVTDENLDVDALDCNQETEDMVEVDLGINLICQLDSVFGTNAIQADNLRDMNTTVFLPRSIGQQLYATWLESLFNQIEEQRIKMIKDDEALAKELQQKESKKPKPLSDSLPRNNLNEFVDMAYTWSAYKADNNEWRQSSPENLAMKLTKAKLFEIFPNMDRDALIDVFTSNDNNFGKTVEMLKYMLPNDVDDKIRTAGKSLLDQVKEEVQTLTPSMQSLATAYKKRPQNLSKKDADEAKKQALHDFEENRNMAMHHSHLRAECFIKARDAIQRGQNSVAYYYSSVANLHNSKIDKFNNWAANAIVEVHSFNQNNQDMLDLHYLHANEAVECLDIFLDRHIKELKDNKRGYKYAFVITGRGLHSAGGFSTIKARVKNRVRERQLSWAEVNPGLLKVKLQYISPFTHDLIKNR